MLSVLQVVATVTYGDPAAFDAPVLQMGQFLLSSAAGPLNQVLATAVASGESEEAVTDAIPVVGVFLQAVIALGLTAQIAETSRGSPIAEHVCRWDHRYRRYHGDHLPHLGGSSCHR